MADVCQPLEIRVAAGRGAVTVTTISQDVAPRIEALALNWALTRVGGKRYVIANKGNKVYYLHRVILGCDFGDGNRVDHINGNTSDNRLSNLRIVTAANNAANAKLRRDNTTGYKGVSKSPNGRFYAYIHIDKTKRHLGTFINAEDAARAYDNAARALFHEYCCINFPRDSEQGARAPN